jgi:hypothetical protein
MRRPLFFCAAGAVLLSLVMHAACAPADRVLLAAAAACALLAVLVGGSGEENPLPAQLAFGVAFLHGLYWFAFEQPWGQVSLKGLSLLALVVGSAYLCVHLRASLQKARFWLLVILFAAMATAVLRESPEAAWPALGAALVCAWALARAGGLTGELAALALLYQPSPLFRGGWHFVVGSPGKAQAAVSLALAVTALVVLVASAQSPRWRQPRARVLAAGAAIWLGIAVLSDWGCEAAWPACAILCAAAALSAKREPLRSRAGLDA